MVRFIATSTALVLAVASGVHAAGPTAPLNVTVTNTPLPVTGTLSGSVTGSVSVTNTAASPVPVRDVASAATRPIQFVLCSSGGGAGQGICGSVPSNVVLPPDRRMVIEYVSGGCTDSSDVALVQVFVFTSVNGVVLAHRVHLEANPLDKRFPDVAQQTRLYADAGSSVGMEAQVNGTDASFAQCVLNVSGYTVTQ